MSSLLSKFATERNETTACVDERSTNFVDRRNFGTMYVLARPWLFVLQRGLLCLILSFVSKKNRGRPRTTEEHVRQLLQASRCTVFEKAISLGHG